MKPLLSRLSVVTLILLISALPAAAQPVDEDAPGAPDAPAEPDEPEQPDEPDEPQSPYGGEEAPPPGEETPDGEAESGPANAPPPKGQSVIWGIVADSATGEPIADVAVDVVGTEYAAVTSATGEFRLVLPPGKYNLRYWTDTHGAIRARGVVVWAGVIRRVDVRLERIVDAVPEEFVVEAPPPSSGMDAATLDRKKSSRAEDVVTREEISKSADKDAAQAAKRVVGATIVGSRFVYVRGLGERYTNAQLNGAPLPSPEPDRAAVPLDLFPTAVLERLTIVKTFTPDSPGDFAGGSVRVTTRQAPDEFLFKSSISLGFNTNTTFRERLSHRGSSTDWLGFDSGLRSFPPELPDDHILAPASERPDGTRISANPDRDPAHARHGRALNTYMSATRSFTLPSQSLSMVVGDGWKLGRKHRVGYITSLNYGRSYKIRHEKIRQFEVDSSAPGGLGVEKDIDSETGSEDINWGAFGSLMYEYGKNHHLNLIAFHSQLSDNVTRSLNGFWASQDGYLHTTRLQFISRALNVLQLQGEHVSEELGGGRLNWNLSYSIATRNEPDTRDVVYAFRDDFRLIENGTVTEVPAWVFVDGSESGRHFFSEQSEQSKAVGLDWTQPLIRGDARTNVKVGGAANIRDRDFYARRMALRAQLNQRNDSDFVCVGEEWDESCPDQLFVPSNIGPLLYLQENTRPEDSYTADLDVYAGYAMGDAHLTRDLRVITGARVEKTHQVLDPTDPLNIGADIQGARLESTDVLPAFSLIYSATAKSKMRFSLTRTLARPQLRELAPFAYSDFFAGRQTSGNPDLELTKITNADLRFEFFPRLSEVLAFSFFYKHFVGAIEPVVGASGDSGLITFQNAPDANLIGLELESRVGLRSLESALHNFALVSNLTLSRSRIQVEQTDRDYLTNLSRPMVNQAPYVFNLALDFDHEEAGLQSRLSYNLSGPQLVQVGARGLEDSWQQPAHSLDFNVKQNLGDHFNVGFKANNLLNPPYVQTSGRTRRAYNVERRYRDGVSFGIGAGYTH